MRSARLLPIALVLILVASLSAPLRARGADDAVLEAERARIAVVDKASTSVVAIFANGGQGGGSGVVITPDGYVLSNYHVTSGAGDFMKCGMSDGRLYDGVIVGIDPTGDVALVKLFGRDDFPHAPLGDSDAVQVGDWTFAMGNPFLLATDFQPTVTYGIVSGTHRYQYPAGTILEYTDCIQVDASINPGNSGGPLFNARGELIGINGRGSFEKRGRVNSGAGYAISINQIKYFMDHLRSGRVVDHATLGATVTTRDDGAVVVNNILESSEAYRRGLREDDEIVSFAGRPIRSVNQFKNVLGIFPKGWKLPLTYRRDGDKREIYVRLRALHRAGELPGEGPAEPRVPRDDKDQPGGDTPKPGDRTPGDKQPGKGERPAVRRLVPPKPAPPAHLAQYFAERPGFANYYFNLQERTRVLKHLASLGDFSGLAGPWRMSAELSEGVFPVPARATFSLKDAGVGMELPAQQKIFGQLLEGAADLEDEPPETGGLLLALHHLRLLLTRGPAGFDDLYYLGTEPLDGRGETVDVLVGEFRGSESYWFFSRASGQLLGFDTYRMADVDACEIRFASVQSFGTVTLPATGTIRHAEQDVASFRIEDYKLTPGSAQQPADNPAGAKPPAGGEKAPAEQPDRGKPDAKAPDTQAPESD